MLSLNSQVLDQPIVAIDTETSGAYPLNAEICEVAAVKYYKGKEIDRYQSLVRIGHAMPKEIEDIHGISDAMLKDAPAMSEIAQPLFAFIQDAVLIGHHIQFDMGFLAIEFEKYCKQLPENIVLCTSLLSRALFSESPNHKLQTLVDFLRLDKGTAHRAMDDAIACLQLFLRCLERVPEDATLKELEETQDLHIEWSQFSLNHFLDDRVGSDLVALIRQQQTCFINYKSPNNKKDNYREIMPKGLVLNPQKGFVPALCLKDMKDKRFYIERIQEVKLTNPYES
tara:strand:+ start:22384 stop:23232 length:849 start_codon:yes stop_codon:yes gene_type:complete